MKKIVSCILFLLMIGGNCRIYATTEETNNLSSLQTTAIVTEIGEIKELQTDYATSKVQVVKVEVLEGEYATKEFTIDYTFSYDLGEQNDGYQLEVGDKVTVQIVVDESGNVVINVVDLVRNTKMIALGIIFLVSIALVMGKQGIRTILSLLVIGFSVYFILIKGIYHGNNTILMTILAMSVIAVLNAMIAMGLNKKALAVALATLCSTLISGMIAGIFSHWCKLSGIFEDTISLNTNMEVTNFSFRDLIFVGIMIASLGICMNLSSLLVSKLDEMKNKTEDMVCKELFKTGMNVGRNLVDPTINALVMLYSGSALTILFMFLACNVRVREMWNKETMAEDAIAAMAGGIGVLLCVPITAIFYAMFNYRKTIYKTKSENKLEGNRSLKL